MTLIELAARTGEDPATIRGLVAARVLEATEGFTDADVERVRLVQVLRRRGIEPAAVGDALRKQLDVFDRYLAQLYPDGDYPSITLDDAAAAAGLETSFARRVAEAGGITTGERLAEADVDALRSVAFALAVGFPEEALLQLVRVYADALNRVGETEARLFHFYVHERLRSEGMRGDALDTATTQSVEQLLGLVEPSVLYFHRRGLARAVRDDLALHLAEDAGILPPDDETGRLVAAVGFIDLARFTSLTDVMGDAAATAVLNRFSDLVRRHVLAHDGRIVKQIGDAFMLVFNDARSAVETALDVRVASLEEPQFLGTRQGLHWGAVLYREGDYYGGTVNLAARVVAEAAPDTVLVSAALRQQLLDVAGIEFTHRGARHLKHVADPMDVYEAVRPGETTEGSRAVDPVCGMTIDAADAPVRLQSTDRDVAFCSNECLRRFAADPERYA